MQVITVLHHLGPAYTANAQGSLADLQPYHTTSTSEDASEARAKGAGTQRTACGVIDLDAVPTPLLPEADLVYAFHAGTETYPRVDVCLDALGGLAAARMFSRETQLSGSGTDPRGLVGSLRNHAPAGLYPRHAHLVGGVRTFAPSGAAVTLEHVGGVALLVEFVSEARTSEELRLAVELFVGVVRQSYRHARELERMHGYQVSVCV